MNEENGTARATGAPSAGEKVAPAPGGKRNLGQGPNYGGTISAEERWNMIAEAAYRRAAKREFVGGDLVEDWSRAEADIDARLAETKVTVIP